MHREDAPLAKGHQPRPQGASQHGLQMCSLPRIYCLCPLASVSTKSRLCGLEEVPPHASPSTAPTLWASPLQLWKYLWPSLSTLQQAFQSDCQSSSMAVRQPGSLTGGPRSSPSQGHTQEALGPQEFPHIMAPKHSQAVTVSCLLMKTHQEPLRATR